MHTSPSNFGLLPPPPNPQDHGSTTFSSPPNDGSLVLPQVIDYHLKNSPNHPLFLFEDEPSRLRHITWAEGARAIHCVGRLFRDRLPTQTATGPPVVAFLAVTDTPTYFAMIHGAIRVGCQPFPISPRNSPAAVAHLLTQTNAQCIFVSGDQAMQHLLASALELRQDEPTLPVYDIPVFEDIYPITDDEFEPLPMMEHPGLETPAMILHSSGSTAFPKPIVITHRVLVQWLRFPTYGEVQMCGSIMAALAFPMFHAMGVVLSTLPFAGGISMSVFKPTTPPAIPIPENVIAGVKATKSTILFCVPSFIEAWASNPAHVSILKTLSHLIFGGAPLSKGVGDSLSAQGVPLLPLYGMTEVGGLNVFLPKMTGKDWEYFSISEQVKLHCIPQTDGTGAVEPYIMASTCLRPAKTNVEVDGVPGYATNDLLLPHPTKPGLWRIYGRIDDQIMLSTGEKTNPGPIESIILKDPHIAGVAMFGRGKFQNGILVEPKAEFHFDPIDTEKLSAFRNLVWPSIEVANNYAPSHSRIFKEMLVVANSNKPFSYTAKGTTRRPIVIAEYNDEIEAAYAAIQESVQTNAEPPSTWDVESSTTFVRQVVFAVLGHDVADEDDIFQHGCDSLQATWIRNTILQALRTSKISIRDIPQNFVYMSPTILSLGQYLHSVCQPSDQYDDPQQAKILELQSIVSRYTTSFPQHQPTPAHSDGSDSVVLITGTTGGLGSNILAQLVTDSSISRIYVLNRPVKGSTSRRRQSLALVDRGLDAQTVINSPKVVLLEGNPSLSNLDLPAETYAEIRDSVTYIIHAAWKVDFNLTLTSFEPLIRGVRNLIELSLASPRRGPPRLVFASSIGIFRNWTSSEPVKEEPVQDPQVVTGSGYSESKWVAERILQAAAEQTTFKPIIVRIGQLSGGANGCWNRTEWFPSIVRSGEVIGCLPDGNGGISWLPLENAASAMIQFRNTPSDIQVLHLAHPRPMTWSTIIPHVSEAVGAALVPYSEWFGRLEASTKGVSEVHAARHNPALLLLDWFRTENSEAHIGRDAMGIVRLDTTRAALVASALSEERLGPIGKEDVERWLDYWREIGFLNPV